MGDPLGLGKGALARAQGRLGGQALGDVPDAALESAVGELREADFRRQARPVLAPVPPLDEEPGSGRGLGEAHVHVVRGQRIVVRAQARRGPRQELIAGVAQHPADRRVRLDVAAGLVRDEDAVGRLVDERAVELLAFAQGPLGGDALAPQARSDPCHELVESDRLREVVVGADTKTRGQRILEALAGQHQDRHGCRLRLLPERAHDVEARHPGHTHVEDHEADCLTRDELERGFAARRLADVEALASKVHRDELARCGVVIDDEDGCFVLG
jgi:hypothetical protein